MHCIWNQSIHETPWIIFKKKEKKENGHMLYLILDWIIETVFLSMKKKLQNIQRYFGQSNDSWTELSNLFSQSTDSWSKSQFTILAAPFILFIVPISLFFFILLFPPPSPPSPSGHFQNSSVIPHFSSYYFTQYQNLSSGGSRRNFYPITKLNNIKKNTQNCFEGLENPHNWSLLTRQMDPFYIFFSWMILQPPISKL